MSWVEIRDAADKLADAVRQSGDMQAAWTEFEQVCQRHAEDPPNHIRGIFQRLERHRGDRARCDVVVVDHGCGTGTTLLFLIALGYRTVFGLDVLEMRIPLWQYLFNKVLQMPAVHWILYEGSEIPIEDGTVDAVYSQEVVEHVPDEQLNAYYSEEHRILKVGGAAFHSVPHRLVPFEAHTETWLLHWFMSGEPWIKSVVALGRKESRARNNLYLRWPGLYRQTIKRYFGNCKDVTYERLLALSDFSYYDGPKNVRALVGAVFSWPIVGKLAAKTLSVFFTMDTVSIKNTG